MLSIASQNEASQLILVIMMVICVLLGIAVLISDYNSKNNSK